MTNILNELNKKEEQIKKVDMLLNGLKARKDVYVEQWKEKRQELINLGIDPKNIAQVEKEINEEVLTLEEELKQLLPDDVLDKYSRMSVDDVLNQQVMDNIDLEQDF